MIAPPSAPPHLAAAVGQDANHSNVITWIRVLPPMQQASPSCAIVGSGGLLLGRHLGARIEAHQLVVRVNRIVVNSSLGADLGNRTDVLFSKLTRYEPGKIGGVLLPFVLGSEAQIATSMRCYLVKRPGGRSMCPFRAFVFRGGGADGTAINESAIAEAHAAKIAAYAAAGNGTYTRKNFMAELRRVAPLTYLSLGYQQPDIFSAVNRMVGAAKGASTGFHAVQTFRRFCSQISLFGFMGNNTYDGHPIIDHMLDREHRLLREMQATSPDGLARVEVVA